MRCTKLYGVLMAIFAIARAHFDIFENRQISSELIVSSMAVVSSCQCFQLFKVRSNCSAATYGKYDNIEGGDVACHFTKYDINHIDLVEKSDSSIKIRTFIRDQDCTKEHFNLGYVSVAHVGCLYISTDIATGENAYDKCREKAGVLASFSSVGRLQALGNSSYLVSPRSGLYWRVDMKKIGDQRIWGDGIVQVIQRGVYPWLAGKPDGVGNAKPFTLLHKNAPNSPVFFWDNTGESEWGYICSP